MQNAKKIFIVYYGENLWKLTDDEAEAKQLDPNYKLATLNDLNDWGCVGGFFTDDVIEVEEGLFKWNPEAIEEEYLDGRIEYYGNYELVI